jgi:hypothetical protein
MSSKRALQYQSKPDFSEPPLVPVIDDQTKLARVAEPNECKDVLPPLLDILAERRKRFDEVVEQFDELTERLASFDLESTTQEEELEFRISRLNQDIREARDKLKERAYSDAPLLLLELLMFDIDEAIQERCLLRTQLDSLRASREEPSEAANDPGILSITLNVPRPGESETLPGILAAVNEEIERLHYEMQEPAPTDEEPWLVEADLKTELLDRINKRDQILKLIAQRASSESALAKSTSTDASGAPKPANGEENTLRKVQNPPPRKRGRSRRRPPRR